MLERNVNGYQEFYQRLRDFLHLSEKIDLTDFEGNPYMMIKSPRTFFEFTLRPQYRKYYSKLQDIFDYPFYMNDFTGYKKYMYACFVYSYLRDSKKEIYFNTLDYVEITRLTRYFAVDNLREHVDMMQDIQTDADLYPTMNQLGFDRMVELINLLHEIADLFIKPVIGFSDENINQIMHHPIHSNDFQSYFHNITSQYFNYQQMHNIKTFKSHKNYIRALYLSNLVDITCIDDSVLKVLGSAFYDNVQHFDLKSVSKEKSMINFALISELLYNIGNATHEEIGKISNMISIAASVDLTQVINLF